jgi:3-dehydroquinate dehydratase/shikimate dehydrogenase
MHDFNGRPKDLTRRLLDAWSEPAAAAVKFAFRARSIRDNLEIFEILRDAPKPTIGLGMGEFGLMSRVLAPKFGGYLTFASLRDTAATAPGQPTIHDLLGMYRFRSIGRDTKVYGVIGWPVSQSMGPLIHNAGFAAVGWDGVYLPLPVAADENDPSASDASFKATFAALSAQPEPLLSGASVTIPHKSRLNNAATEHHLAVADSARITGVANTFAAGHGIANTDAEAIATLLADPSRAWTNRRVALIGAGGVAVAAGITLAALGATVVIYNRTAARAESLAKAINASVDINGASLSGKAVAAEMDLLPKACCDTFINCTPVGMAGGPGSDGLSIPIPDLNNVDAGTVFFDTVYNPIETPMLKAARQRGCRTIDGVQMFIRQAAAQFELWTGQPAPVELFDRLVREQLDASD